MGIRGRVWHTQEFLLTYLATGEIERVQGYESLADVFGILANSVYTQLSTHGGEVTKKLRMRGEPTQQVKIQRVERAKPIEPEGFKRKVGRPSKYQQEIEAKIASGIPRSDFEPLDKRAVFESYRRKPTS